MSSDMTWDEEVKRAQIRAEGEPYLPYPKEALQEEITMRQIINGERYERNKARGLE